MSGRNKIAFAAATLWLSLGIAGAGIAMAGKADQQVCDVGADYALGIEDYPDAIRLHAAIVRKYPDNALAHYHLGFAEGMLGNGAAELKEYQRAAGLRLTNWDLFLNLGLAQLDDGELDATTESLQRAVVLGPEHSQSHYNLALAYERRGQLADAEREVLASLRLDPGQADARNSLAVIYAEEGQTLRAAILWSELAREVPDYEPARRNLVLLGSHLDQARGETAAVSLPPAAVKPEH